MAVYLVSPVRTPIGRYGGGLASLSAADLGVHAVKAVLERSGADQIGRASCRERVYSSV